MCTVRVKNRLGVRLGRSGAGANNRLALVPRVPRGVGEIMLCSACAQPIDASRGSLR